MIIYYTNNVIYCQTELPECQNICKIFAVISCMSYVFKRVSYGSDLWFSYEANFVNMRWSYTSKKCRKNKNSKESPKQKNYKMLQATNN